MAAAYSYFFTERFADAVDAAQRSAYINPEFVPAAALLVASYTRNGQLQEAKVAARRLISLSPDFRVGDYIRVGRFPPDLNEKYAAALREAGLPE